MRTADLEPSRSRSAGGPPASQATATGFPTAAFLAASLAWALAASLAACSAGLAPSHPAQRPSKTVVRTTPPSLPSGFHMIGGQAAGVTVAVPDAWIAIDFTRQSVAEAVHLVHLSGIPHASVQRMMQALHRERALYAVNPGQVNVAQRFATNINAYCGPSGTTKTGSAGDAYMVATIAAADYASHARLLKALRVSVGHVPGLLLTTALDRRGTLIATTLEALPRPGRACFVVYTGARPGSRSSILAVISPTIRFP